MKIVVNRKDVIWSYLATLFSMIVNFLILPFVLRYLDDSSIGLYYIFTSLSGISALFDFGFTVSFSRNIAYCWSGSTRLNKEGADSVTDNAGVDFVLMKKVLYTSKIVYALISCLALLLGLSAGTFYIISISRELTGYSHIVAWILYAFAVFFNLYFGYYASYLRGVGAVQQVCKITIFSRLLQVVIAAISLVFGAGLIGVAVAYLLYGFVFRTISRYKFYKFENIGDKLKDVSITLKIETIKPVFKTVWYNASKEGIVSLSNYLLNQAGTVICSAYFSLYETGLYSLCVQLATAVSTIASTMYTTYQPSLQSAYVRRDNDGQKRAMSMIVLTYIVLFFIGIVTLILFGRPIISWLRPSYTLSIPMILLVATYQFILKFRNCYTTYFSSTNRLIYAKSFVISAVLCVLLSILLVETTTIGIWGLILAQITSQLFFNFWYWPMKAHKELSLKPGEMVQLAWISYIGLIHKRRN